MGLIPDVKCDDGDATGRRQPEDKRYGRLCLTRSGESFLNNPMKRASNRTAISMIEVVCK